MGLKPSILAVLLALSPAHAAESDGDRQWIGDASAEGGALIYGTPHTDDVVIGFSCDRASEEVVVTFAFEPVGATDGMEIDMELFSEGGTALLNATGHRMLLDDGFVLEARTSLGPALRAILTEGLTLSVVVQDGVAEIPLAGAAEEADALIEACGG